MVENEAIFDTNVGNYEDLYSKDEAFLRFPADWVIRFHNMYMKDNIPSGKILDYGCGSGNNSVFFLKNNYQVWGVDVAKNSPSLVKRNFEFHNINMENLKNFSVIPPDNTKLPFEDGFFDFIISNQVLYYLPSEEQIKAVVKELYRCLKPGGAVFFTMLGPKSYYIKEKTKQIHEGKIHEVVIDDPNHRLNGLHEMIYLVETEDELKNLFGDFETITTGYFDQKLFDVTSNFHWIFAGEKR